MAQNRPTGMAALAFAVSPLGDPDEAERLVRERKMARAARREQQQRKKKKNKNSSRKSSKMHN